jgi:hypothetical protein
MTRLCTLNHPCSITSNRFDVFDSALSHKLVLEAFLILKTIDLAKGEDWLLVNHQVVFRSGVESESREELPKLDARCPRRCLYLALAGLPTLSRTTSRLTSSALKLGLKLGLKLELKLNCRRRRRLAPPRVLLPRLVAAPTLPLPLPRLHPTSHLCLSK